jgi:hypothetical protein
MMGGLRVAVLRCVWRAGAYEDVIDQQRIA